MEIEELVERIKVLEGRVDELEKRIAEKGTELEVERIPSAAIQALFTKSDR